MADRPDYRPLETTYSQAAFFASLMAPVIAAIGFGARLGFPDDSLWTWAKFVGLSWFLVNFSYAAQKACAPPAIRSWPLGGTGTRR